MKTALFFICCVAAAQTGVFTSSRYGHEFAPTADPNAPQWKHAPAVIAENDPLGPPIAGYRSEIRSRWTADNLHFLFICPYQKMYPKPGQPETVAETNKLWDYDVAEVFIGWDWKNINLYKEFEISPRGEWVDLDIDHANLSPNAIDWNSGFKLKTRIDEVKKIWYGEVSIPWKSIAPEPPKAGQRFRLNLYRIQGPPSPDRIEIAWQKTGSRSFHVPEAFGTLQLGGK